MTQAKLLALDCTPPEVTAAKARRLAVRLYGIDGEAEPLYGERERNFRIRAGADDIILKISSHEEVAEAIELQASVLSHLAQADPSLHVPSLRKSKNGRDHETVQLDGHRHIVRAFRFLEGELLEGRTPTVALLRDVGRTVGRLDRALRGYFHPGAGQRIAWDLKCAPEVARHTPLIADKRVRQLVEATYARFNGSVLPRLGGLPGQVIHNDTHPGNLLTDPDRTRVVGLLDFGDTVHGARLLDVALPAAEVTIAGVSPLDCAAEILAGYQGINPLEEDEIALLYDAILARHAQSLTILAYRRAHDPAAAAPLATFERHSIDGLEALTAAGPDRALIRFREAAGIGRTITVPLPRLSPETAQERASLMARRKRLLGPDLELTYNEPIHIVRGEGVWLHDADGRRYLDCYNNVPQVGHAHRHVVEAIARQAATLNTNTRYLHSLVLDFAERLTALMPADGGLSVCIFVNCGSEANDIAWRMATAWTGKRGALVMDQAYHGGTEAVAALSPYHVHDGLVAPHVRKLEAPDTYRGRFGAAHEDAGAAYAADADRAIAELDAAGYGTAIWMVDTGFTSNGLINPPAGYVRAVADKVRAAGGLVIADEVQFGFGRSGSHFWGFDTHGVIPDIVTMGKPVGNGHPLGVIVTRPEILAKFAKESNYFSTFGGNPVSIAAGLAVLDVIERERLQENARTTGTLTLQRLSALMQRHGAIGDVRGYGLKFGVEIVSDRATKAPDQAAAKRIANSMRSHGVLVGTEGAFANVLKIRPPLPFRSEHAEILTGTLDAAITSLT